MLKDKIINRKSGIITYGITPPKKTALYRKSARYQKQIERINSLDIDGLVLYDLQDERQKSERSTLSVSRNLDPYAYSTEYLEDIKVPKSFTDVLASTHKTTFPS